jgi:hypothetical protein
VQPPLQLARELGLQPCTPGQLPQRARPGNEACEAKDVSAPGQGLTQEALIKEVIFNTRPWGRAGREEGKFDY